MVERRALYVGRARKLHSLLRPYGAISPRFCFENGQETNCRMNTQIYDACAKGERIDVFVRVTPDYVALEAEMISDLRPPWNRSGVAAKERCRGVPRSKKTSTGD